MTEPEFTRPTRRTMLAASAGASLIAAMAARGVFAQGAEPTPSIQGHDKMHFITATDDITSRRLYALLTSGTSKNAAATA